MQLSQILGLLDDQVHPDRCKLHLAGWNQYEDPLDVYLAGRFNDWQSWQRRKNFERPFVVSLISLPQSRWLFAGLYESAGCDWNEQEGMYRYRLSVRKGPEELNGRLIAYFERPGRQAYLYFDKWIHAIQVAEIRSEKIRVSEFPGYSSAMLTKQHLDIVVREGIESWRAALSSVAGVYVVTDRHTGKLYVGSATGEGGIWNRWSAYSATGHGGNRELRELLKQEGEDYAENFQFGVLEIADTHASAENVMHREAYWKGLLRTRAPYGYNAN